MDELEEIANDFDSASGGTDNSRKIDTESENNGEEISKQELAEKFDVRFAKISPQSQTQHLVQHRERGPVCGRVEFTSDTKIVDSPSPFDPICKRCRASIMGKSLSGNTGGETYNDLRRWLANEVEGVKEPKKEDSSEALRKSEAAAVVTHIKSLKNELNQHSSQ